MHTLAVKGGLVRVQLGGVAGEFLFRKGFGGVDHRVEGGAVVLCEARVVAQRGHVEPLIEQEIQITSANQEIHAGPGYGSFRGSLAMRRPGFR